MTDKHKLPKGRRAREKALQSAASNEPSSPLQPSSTVSDSPEKERRDPFERATTALTIFASAILYLYAIGWWFNKPILGVLIEDPINTLKHILLAPVLPLLKLFGVEHWVAGVLTPARVVEKVVEAIKDDF
ncbi:hypothetical protein HDU78_009691 [Chytriomyces hyalinus]|nr:hypothetical protein HDU78_009691 [Chytriomyces hyalinus]KAJ3262834.1 hypothetical protein HDU77_011772 [Chytriomyces hyalinus]